MLRPVSLRLPATLWLDAGRRAFRAGMTAAPGWAGACFSGVRPSEIGPGRPRFPWAFGGDSSAQRARAAPDTFVYVPPMPKTWRNRLRNKPLPTLPIGAFAFGRGGVSRPIEGLDSHGAVRTLRTSVWPTNSSASRLRVLTVRGRTLQGKTSVSLSGLASRTTSAWAICRGVSVQDARPDTGAARFRRRSQLSQFNAKRRRRWPAIT